MLLNQDSKDWIFEFHETFSLIGPEYWLFSGHIYYQTLISKQIENRVKALPKGTVKFIDELIEQSALVLCMLFSVEIRLSMHNHPLIFIYLLRQTSTLSV